MRRYLALLGPECVLRISGELLCIGGSNDHIFQHHLCGVVVRIGLSPHWSPGQSINVCAAFPTRTRILWDLFMSFSSGYS